MSSRNTPAAIQRQLRQEAGFGCANCGNPILDYHHIIEWNEKQHFDPEHMVAICPTCHRQFGKLSKQKAYSLKQNPFNIRHKRFKGYLGGNGKQKALKVGDMIISNCTRAVDFAGNSIFSYKLEGEEFRLDTFIPNKDFWPDILISQSNIDAEIDDFWDIEFKTNWVKFRKNKNDIFFSVDFRGDFVTINAHLDLLGQAYEFSNNGLEGPNGVKLSGGSISNGFVGLRFGPKGRILPPNYAMAHPKPIYIKIP